MTEEPFEFPAGQMRTRRPPDHGGESAGEAVALACPPEAYRRKRVLLIVPDGTRTAPIGLIFKAVFAQIGAVTDQLDVMIALGTH